MTSLVLRRTAGFAIACAVGFACSGKRPVANAFMSAYVGPGTGNSSICSFQSDEAIVLIGTPTTPEPSVVTNGDFQPGWGNVHLYCKVDSAGGGSFHVQLSAEVDGPTGGSVSVVGTVGTNGGTNLQGGFTSATNGTFSDSTCTVDFTYNMLPVPVGGSPIASGRIWAHIDCPHAVQSETSVQGDDGGFTERTCDGHADMLFQNCE